MDQETSVTREQMDQAQRQDNEERRQRAESAFEAIYGDWLLAVLPHIGPHLTHNRELDWETVASEMGISDFYRKLKEGK
jgi:hypothetical protein